MAKTKISEFSATPGNNTDIDGINISEGCAPSGINDAIRELMSQLKDFQAGTAGDSFNGPVGTTTAAAGAFTTLSASGAVTLSGGTANGVVYLNASKVLTTGSALTFDGTNLGIGTSSPGVKLDVVGAANASNPIARFGAISGPYIGIGTEGTNYSWIQAFAGKPLYINPLGNDIVLNSGGGNLGLGVTPSAWNSSSKVIEQPYSVTFGSLNGNTLIASHNAVNTATGWKYTNSAQASTYLQVNGIHAWYTAPSGTAGNAITFTQAMTLDASGRLGVGTTSPSQLLHLASSSASDVYTRYQNSNNGTFLVGVQGSTGDVLIYSAANTAMRFATNDIERARIDPSGNFIQSAPTTPPTLSTNGTMVFNLTSNTNLRVSVRGSDGVTRTANITLA